MDETFSEDIVLNILSRLPLKEVARMRVVCKRWHALTSEHHFLCTCFSRSTTDHSIAGFFLSDKLHRKFTYVPLHQYISNSQQQITPDLSFIPSTPHIDRGQIFVSASCHGLVVCTRPMILNAFKSTWYVCNPVTRKFVEIAVPDESQSHFLFLAYDPLKSQHYKIIAMTSRRDIHVYSSQTRSWRIVLRLDRTEHPFPFDWHPNVFWSGSLVWVASNRLVRFVIDDEQVTKMPMPPTPEGWLCAYVGESGGHLQMIGFTQQERLTGFLDVLEMQEGSAEWSVLYRVHLRRVIELYPSIQRPYGRGRLFSLRFGVFPLDDDDEEEGTGDNSYEYLALWPMYVVRGAGEHGGGGMMLFSIPGKVMCYYTDDHKFSIVYGEPVAPEPGTYQFHSYNLCTYKPSLFSCTV